MQRLFILIVFVFTGCANRAQNADGEIKTGASRMDEYLTLLNEKRVGLLVNHSSLVGNQHLLDTLLSLDVAITKVFTPEHGFTGTKSDGETVEYDQNQSTYELISLYGKNKKATPAQMQGLDIMIFDIQDVGTRFFTYISTMHYLMEACAENDVPLIILDRPNPNGSYVDGPVLDTAFQSFVGMHPIPIVHGMTVGELAQMINGEGWLSNSLTCDLTVIKMENWNHNTTYSLPVKPSPNLPNDLSIALYPSLCLFEGTIMSVGRGTDYAFLQIGHPEYPDSTHSFIPRSREGAKWPPYQDQVCFGKSWIESDTKYAFSLQPLIQAYQEMGSDSFFNDYFKRLAGTDQLQKQIEAGLSEEEIRESWESMLSHFKKKRKNYLLYD